MYETGHDQNSVVASFGTFYATPFEGHLTCRKDVFKRLEYLKRRVKNEECVSSGSQIPLSRVTSMLTSRNCRQGFLMLANILA